MKSPKSLNEKILITTIKIKKEFPELAKYLNEVPEHSLSIPRQGVSNKDLQDYLDSLNQLLDGYSKEHKKYK